MIERLDAALSGRYAVEREIGQGGMAMVYLAVDVRHDRKVAIKVLRPELAAVVGGERFLAEIRTTAALQHPHILPLHDSGEADTFLFYVMPYVEGESLRDRLERERQLRIDEALAITRKVADALDYAHGKGVVHRDIKPANILLSERGEPLISDFGIALAVSQAGGGRITETGLSLGTPHYMSPEQATGERDVDPRSDVYALGCVLHEMLAGQPPFAAPTAQAVLARILTERPRPVTELRPTVPPNVAAAITKSLEKLPADRFGGAVELVEALDDPAFRYDSVPGHVPVTAVREGRPTPPARRLRAAVPWLLLAAAVAVAVPGWLGRPEEPPPRHTLRVSLTSEGSAYWFWWKPRISADGSRIAFQSDQGVLLRDADQPGFRLLPGTESSDVDIALSPGGEWVAFTRDGDLFKVSVTGSPPITLVRDSDIRARQPHWGRDGTIVFLSQGTLWRVGGGGGDATRLTEPGTLATRPALLPDGSGVLFTGTMQHSYLLDLADGEVTLLVEEAVNPVYVPTGHVLYAHPRGGLFALPFDLASREPTGTPVPVLDEVGASGSLGHFDVSADGTLVYARAGGLEARMLLVEPDGATDTVRLEPRSFQQPRFSPDGNRISFNSGGGVRSDDRQVFVYDLVLQSLRQLSFEGGHAPVWSPDGSHLAYSSEGPDTDAEDLWIHPADGSSAPRHVLALPGDQHAEDWPSDTLLVFDHQGDLYVVNAGGDGAGARPYADAEFSENELDVSSSGTHAAYVTGETGRPEVFVREFPVPRGKWRVSGEGGRMPRWSEDGTAVYYVTPDDAIVRTEVRLEPSVTVLGSEVVWRFSGIRDWDLDPATGRAVVTVNLRDETSAEGNQSDPGGRVWLAVNWFEELRRRLEGG